MNGSAMVAITGEMKFSKTGYSRPTATGSAQSYNGRRSTDSGG
jgi:hypothetical protein